MSFTDEERTEERAAAYVKALKHELEGYKRSGEDESAAAVEAEIKRVTAKPKSEKKSDKSDDGKAA